CAASCWRQVVQDSDSCGTQFPVRAQQPLEQFVEPQVVTQAPLTQAWPLGQVVEQFSVPPQLSERFPHRSAQLVRQVQIGQRLRQLSRPAAGWAWQLAVQLAAVSQQPFSQLWAWDPEGWGLRR